MLDVFINGPGFGESVILRWKVDGEYRGGLVDCYSPGEGESMVEWLRELELERLEFLVLTHPHLDHLCNAYVVLSSYERAVERLWLWGGTSLTTQIKYFDRLAELFTTPDGRLRKRAKHVFELYKEYLRQWEQHRYLNRDEAYRIRTLYPTGQRPDPLLSMRSISPWPKAITPFVNAVNSGWDPTREIRLTSGEANLASIGLLIEYGEAQILLGADVTGPNWRELRASGGCPRLQPSIVKVSHHGSRTGQIDGMWGPDGFFAEDCKTGNATARPIAVVTPWQGDLPEQAVIDDIRRAGSPVFLTGQSMGDGRRLKPFRSFVHFSVSVDGDVEVSQQATNVRRYAPTLG